MSATKPDPTWQELELGAIIVLPGNAAEYKTGDWRTLRPVWEKTRCVKCGVCYIFCPDAAILETQDGYFEANLYHCKGCGICAHECPTQAITMVEEKE